MASKPGLEKWQIDRILVLKSHELSNRLIAKRMGLARTTVDDVVAGKYKSIHTKSGYNTLLDQNENP